MALATRRRGRNVIRGLGGGAALIGRESRARRVAAAALAARRVRAVVQLRTIVAPDGRRADHHAAIGRPLFVVGAWPGLVCVGRVVLAWPILSPPALTLVGVWHPPPLQSMLPNGMWLLGV